jgi:nucleoside-diphosphate-sugar epimerase/glycosyltransferase involved in cell wall biosynthesis
MLNPDPIFTDNWDEATIAEAKHLPGPVFVVGASGFIGSKLFHSLLQRRDDVFALSTGIESSWRMANLPDEVKRRFLIQVDITDLVKVRDLFARYRPKTIINLSAYGAYERQSDAVRIHEVNYLGTLNLLLAAEEFGFSGFVQTGSSSEYGLNCRGPDEDAELIPNSDYAVSKVASSYLIKYYGKIKSLPVLNLRLYSIYGPWEDRGRLIPKLVQAGLRNQYPSFADRSISRDFVYVDDCTAAIVHYAKFAAPALYGKSVNIASGVKTTLETMANLAQKIFGITASPIFGEMKNRKWDLSDWYGTPKLANETGWKFSTSLEAGLKLTAHWEKNASAVIKSVNTVTESRRKISAIIACYRDHQAIPFMHERLVKVFRKIGVDYEIIFVNDCSPTEDESVIQKITETDVNVVGISHSRNFGSQAAFLSGMEIATGDAVVLLDGDLQDPPELIAEFYEKWISGFDVVYGIRVRREAKLYMQLLYKAFYRLFSHIADIKIPLDAGDFSLIDRKVFKKMFQLTERDVFLRGLRAWVGFKQTGVPYVRPERMFGVSTNNFLKNIWWAKKAIFSFSTKPLEYIQRLGVAIFLGTSALAIFYLINYLINPPSAGRGTTTVILLVLGLSGIQLFSLSILGDYLGKVLEEVKSRPRYLKSKILRTGSILDTDLQIQDYIQRAQKGEL